MIVTCPACKTRFLVDDAMLGATAGRRLRCAGCGHAWTYAAEAAAVDVAAPAAPPAAAASEAVPTTAPGSAEPPLAPSPREEPRPEAPAPAAGSAELPRPTEPVAPFVHESAHDVGALGLVLAAVLVVAAIAVYGAVRSEDTVVALWGNTKHRVLALWDGKPSADLQPAASADSGTGATAGAGLEVTVTPIRTADALVINGAIVNSAAVARAVPRLRVTLRDHNETTVVSKVIDPPEARLAPGATAHFTTKFEHPSIAATGVAVTFATN
jgi:predicted Zn finger-like uncharacterized protein